MIFMDNSHERVMQNKIMHSNCTLRLENNLTKDLGPCWIVTSRPLNVSEVFWIKIKRCFLLKEYLYIYDVEPFLGNFNQICLHMHNKQTNSLAGHNRVFAEQIHLEIKL